MQTLSKFLTQSGLTRYAVAYPVNRLADVLPVVPVNEIENMYDY
jgi:hypothetical protein